MGIFKNIFTWWEGASFGTYIGTKFGGEQVGEDAEGNHYFQSRKEQNGTRRRWVMYNGSNDASRVPPEWHGWLHHTLDALPSDSLPAAKPWELPGGANPSGSAAAYRPAGALQHGGHRAAATGDYKAWSPDAA
jgi:NADH:ubiquinone oxidoreductase subunit